MYLPEETIVFPAPQRQIGQEKNKIKFKYLNFCSLPDNTCFILRRKNVHAGLAQVIQSIQIVLFYWGGGIQIGESRLCYFPCQRKSLLHYSLSLFIFLSSEKNEQRSAVAVIGLNGLPPWSPLGSAELAFAQTVLALFPPSPLRLHRPIKADRGLCICLYSNPPRPAGTPPYRFAPPRHAAGHGRVRRG